MRNKKIKPNQIKLQKLKTKYFFHLVWLILKINKILLYSYFFKILNQTDFINIYFNNYNSAYVYLITIHVCPVDSLETNN